MTMKQINQFFGKNIGKIYEVLNNTQQQTVVLKTIN